MTGADPYCKVTCGGKTVVSPIKKDTLDPAFDSQFVFYVKKPEDATVKVQVRQHGVLIFLVAIQSFIKKAFACSYSDRQALHCNSYQQHQNHVYSGLVYY